MTQINLNAKCVKGCLWKEMAEKKIQLTKFRLHCPRCGTSNEDMIPLIKKNATAEIVCGNCDYVLGEIFRT